MKVPRDYVADLETQVTTLKEQIADLQRQHLPVGINSDASTSHAHPATRIDERNISPAFTQASGSNGSPIQLRNVVKNVRDVVVEPSRQPRFLGQSSGITLAKMVMAAVRVDATTSSPFSEERATHSLPDALAAEASLPPRIAADHLVSVYFQYRTPHLPIVPRSRVETAVATAYCQYDGTRGLDDAAKRDIFITYMVLAIALFDVTSPTGGRPSQSEGCFRSALGLVEHLITYAQNDVDTLQAVLLLAQFVAFCPSRGSLWHLTGFALRLCIDIGLHWETEEQAVQLDRTSLHERRTLWYCTYQFDRVLSITLGRPFGIIDESTRVPLLDVVASSSEDFESATFDVHIQRAHNHLFSMSQLMSEIKHVLHSQTWTTNIAYPRVDYFAWLQDFQPRLQHWYDIIPPPANAHQLSIFAHQAYWDVLYSNALLLLHRPHSIAQHPSTESLFITFDHSSKLIASIKTLQREGKIHIYWQSVHELFMAGLGIIYCLWQSEEISQQRAISSSIATLNACASTLSALSERFPGAAGCRDTFETLSAATIDWLLTHDAEQERQNRLTLQKQVEDLLRQLRPSGTDTTLADYDDNSIYMSNMLSAGNFTFSEILSSTAQWPDLQTGDLNDMTQYTGGMSGYGTEWWQ